MKFRNLSKLIGCFMFLYCSDCIVMILHYREVGKVCYIFHHGATIYAFYFVMVSLFSLFLFTIVKTLL